MSFRKSDIEEWSFWKIIKNGAKIILTGEPIFICDNFRGVTIVAK